MNISAARIGPTVCELDGPMPMVNRSITLIAAALSMRDLVTSIILGNTQVGALAAEGGNGA